MTLEGIDSALLVESAQWAVYRDVKWPHESVAESLTRIDNLLDQRLVLSQHVGQFI